MASGLGVRGTTGRCFGFFADYKDCTTDLKKDRLLRLPQGDDELLSFAEEMKGKFEVCAGIREDYFECLHGTKERARLQKIMLEQQRQKDTAAH